jgi:hypothetical protein
MTAFEQPSQFLSAMRNKRDRFVLMNAAVYLPNTAAKIGSAWNYSITRAPYKDAIIIVKVRCAMEMVSMQVPMLLYEEIQSLAQETHSEPIAMLGRLVKMAVAQKDWLRDLNALRNQIKAEGGLTVGATKEQVVENLRQTRQEIFATEYAL